MNKEMKNIMSKMKKLIVTVVTVVTVVAVVTTCQQTGILHEINRDVDQSNAYIEFGNYVNRMTRASKTVEGGFSLGDTMAVWGEQTTGDVVDVVFNGQDVRYVEGSTWTYNNKKLWNIGSTYLFYGFFPYSKTLYTMSEDANRYITIPVYTTPDNTDDQLDLMISERRDVSPFNTVDMIFHHILSNVNVYVKVSDALDMGGIESVTLKSFRLYNVKSTGHYQQTGWNQDRAVGSWTDVRGVMNIPTLTDVAISQTALAVCKDYLMMPQKLFSTDSQPKDVCLDATFRITYKDGTSSSYIKNGIRLAGITGRNGSASMLVSSWEPNYRYNYMLSFNPEKATRTWDADGDGSIQRDPVTGDTLTKTDDTPYPGTMHYNPDEPDIIYVYEDTDDDGVPDTWNKYPIAWEDIDDDGLLEAGIDRDGDGHIDDVDGDNDTQVVPGGDPDHDPTDGNPSNPTGKDVILIHYDSDGDGDIDDDDEWIQLQKDPDSGLISPAREVEDATIEFTARVEEWAQTLSVAYDIHQ